ncbi:MAG: hypothetical protein ACLR5H_04625 [Oscillospiraceae bacterium]
MLDSTRQFIQAMDAKNIKHSDIEVTQSGMEKVTVIYTGDSIPSIRMIFSSARTARTWPSACSTS